MPKIIKVLNSFHSWMTAQLGSIPDTNKPVFIDNQHGYQVTPYGRDNANNGAISNTHYLFSHSDINESHFRKSTPVTIDITGNQEIFMRFNMPAGNWYMHDVNNGSTGRGDLRKMIKLKNTAGDTVTAFGFEKAATGDHTLLGNLSGKIQINTLNGDANYVTASDTTTGAFNLNSRIGSGSNGPETLNVNFFIHAKIDTANHDQSFLRFFVNGQKQTEITGAACHSHTNMTLGSIVIDDADVCTSIPNASQFTLSMTEVVVSDYLNFSLRAMTLTPTVLTDGNQFSGDISAFSTRYQDKGFLTSPNIVSTVAEFNIARTDAGNAGGGGGVGLIEGVHKLRGIETFVYTRFVDPTTPQVRYGVSLKNDTTTPVIPQQEIIEQANWDSNYYHVRDLGVAQVELNVSDIPKLKAHIEILGV